MKAHVPRERVLPRQLCLKAATGASGILVATRGKLRRLFCLERGWITFATSNLIEEQFPEYLVRQGILEPARRAEVVEEAGRIGRKVSEVLLASGSPPPEALRRGAEGLIHELLSSTLEWPDIETHFDDGLPNLAGEVTVRLPVLPLVLRHARRHPASVDALRVRIGPPDLRPVVAEGADGVWGAAQLDSVALYLIDACDGEADLGKLIGDSAVPEEATLRALYGLLLAGILEPADAKRRARADRGRREAPLTRDECLARLQSAGAGNHYGVLGLERLAPPEQVREAYYALARRYHPDRFRAGDLQDLLPRFEEYFTQVTEAYNTLSDAQRRQDYDQSLVVGAEPEGPKLSETSHLARQNFLRGRALAQQRKWNDAVTFLENAVQLEEGHADYNLELGLVLVRNPRRRADAERFLLRAAELSPTNVASYLALAQMYVRAGRNGPAARMLHEVLRWEAGHVEASRLLAELGPVQDEPAAGSPLAPVFGA